MPQNDEENLTNISIDCFYVHLALTLNRQRGKSTNTNKKSVHTRICHLYRSIQTHINDAYYRRM